MKKIFFLLLILLLILSACTSADMSIHEESSEFNKEKSIIDLDSLTIDQDSTYISLSKNDVSGYNRWVPFYFVLQGNDSCSESAVEEELGEKIKSIILLSEDNKTIFSTSELIWSAFKLPGGTFNLSLVVVPECGNLGNAEIVTVNSLELLVEGNKTISYSLNSYVIEERDTLSDDYSYISMSTMDTTYTEDLTALVDYGFYMTNGEKIASIQIDYPQNFSDIREYEILEIEKRSEKEHIFTIAYHFSNANPKTMFRPFIRVIYENGQTGWRVPPLPAFIN